MNRHPLAQVAHPLAFRDVPASVIIEALSHLGRGTAVSLLEIRLSRSTSGDEWKLDDGRAKRLMKLAVRLSLEALVFTLPVVIRSVKVGRPIDIALSPFSRAKSIEGDTRFLRIKAPRGGAALPALETLLAGPLPAAARARRHLPPRRLGQSRRGAGHAPRGRVHRPRRVPRWHRV
jgi:hypothetical protein